MARVLTIRLAAALVTLSLGTMRCGAQSTPAVLDTLVPRLLREQKVPSIAIAYLRDRRPAWTRVYGEAAPGVPADTTTLYNVASLTKPVLAELVHRLVSQQRLSLDEPMWRTWRDPALPVDADLSRLTLRSALGHRIGFANWRRETGDSLRMVHAVDSASHYSGEGYQYAVRFVERKLRTPVDVLARRVLFGPAGAHDIAFTAQPWMRTRVAQGVWADGSWHTEVLPREAIGADLLVATIGAYARVAASMLRADALTPRSRTLRDSLQAIDLDITRQCAARVPNPCPGRMGMALGWSIAESPTEQMMWHTGSDNGARSIVLLFPATGEGVVMFTNGANGFGVIAPVIELLVPQRPGAQALLGIAK